MRANRTLLGTRRQGHGAWLLGTGLWLTGLTALGCSANPSAGAQANAASSCNGASTESCTCENGALGTRPCGGAVACQCGNGQTAGAGGSAGATGSEFANAAGAGVVSTGTGAAGVSAGTDAGVSTGDVAGSSAPLTPVDAGVPAADAAAPKDPCPAPYKCQLDPVLKMLHYCAKEGLLPLPPACMTDADCTTAGLPGALCLVEEESGLNGCVKLCQ